MTKLEEISHRVVHLSDAQTHSDYCCMLQMIDKLRAALIMAHQEIISKAFGEKTTAHRIARDALSEMGVEL